MQLHLKKKKVDKFTNLKELKLTAILQLKSAENSVCPQA
jgi:hypothetical protein